MHTTETSLYHLMLGYGVLITFFWLLQMVSFAWLHKKFKEKRRLKKIAVMQSREEERERISIAFHSVTAPIVYDMRRKLELAGKVDKRMGEITDCLLEDLNKLDRVNHLLSGSLYPVHLERLGLAASLGDLAAHWEESSGLQIIIDCDELPDFNKVSEIKVYRIAEEIILNAIKHSGASRVELKLYWKAGVLYLTAADDGKGGQRNKTEGVGGRLGLASIYNYAYSLQGEAVLEELPFFKWTMVLKPVLRERIAI